MAERLVRLIANKAGPFRLAVSGGSTPRGLYELLGSERVARRIPWPRIHLFFADERCVPSDHRDSNFGLVKSALLDRLSTPPGCVFRMDCDGADAQEAARRYSAILLSELGSGSSAHALDLVLLGVGPDGHTASLFPGAETLSGENRPALPTLAPAGSRHERVTLSLPVLQRSREVWFLVTGSAKASLIREIHRGDGPGLLPAARVEVRPGQATWFLDRDAAAGLESDGSF